jgi:hypothetical protein
MMPPTPPAGGPTSAPQGGQMAMVDLALLPPEVLDLLTQLGALMPMDPGMGMEMEDPTMGLGPDPAMEAIKRAMTAGPAPTPSGY